MEELYIAVDAGGTKIDIAAVTKEGEILKRVRVSGGINRRTVAEDLIYKTVRSAKAKLSDVIGEGRIALVTGYLMHNTEVFESVFGCPAAELDEGCLGLLAAGIDGDGILILSGTGADAYVVAGGKTAGIVGGYGAILGDDGSGFAIGRAGINAAIAAYEQRGEKTMLTSMLTEKYPAESFRASVYGIYASAETAKAVASFCMECEKAADMGDKVARQIFGDAAKSLADFALAGADMYGTGKDMPFTFAGGVLLHDVKRQNGLIVPGLLDLLSKDGMNNYVKPDKEPIFGAVRHIANNRI